MFQRISGMFIKTCENLDFVIDRTAGHSLIGQAVAYILYEYHVIYPPPPPQAVAYILYEYHVIYPPPPPHPHTPHTHTHTNTHMYTDTTHTTPPKCVCCIAIVISNSHQGYMYWIFLLKLHSGEYLRTSFYHSELVLTSASKCIPAITKYIVPLKKLKKTLP